MSLKVGIIGLANVGKSTLFNALIGSKKAEVSDYPFCTIEPNKGIVEIPDLKLKKVAKALELENIIPAPLEFVDIAGLIKGAHKGEGLGNEFLSYISEVDLLCQVLPYYRENEDPNKHQQIIMAELVLKDLHQINKLLESSDLSEKQRETLENIKEKIDESSPITKLDLSENELEIINEFNFLTAKEIFYVANIAENQLGKTKLDIPEKYIKISAKTEEDLIDLEEGDEKQDYKEALGIDKQALDKIIAKGYSLLKLISFYTIKDEINQIQAWPIEKGKTAKEAAGLIHTDFEENFIKAQIVNWQDLVETSSFKKAGEAGKVMIKGENYQLKDGQIINFICS